MPNLRDELRKEVEAIRQTSGDTVALADVGSMVESLFGTLQGDISAATAEVGLELKRLIRYIEDVKGELTIIRPERIHGEHIPNATGQLEAVVEATAEATEVILGAAEDVEAIADGLPEETGTALRDIATRIFQASSFQDLTGQRITKVVKSLHEIEVKIISLLRALGYLDSVPAPAPNSVKSADTADTGEPSEDEVDLLHGPAMPGEGNTQDDIDALLASFD